MSIKNIIIAAAMASPFAAPTNAYAQEPVTETRPVGGQGGYFCNSPCVIPGEQAPEVVVPAVTNPNTVTLTAPKKKSSKKAKTPSAVKVALDTLRNDYNTLNTQLTALTTDVNTLKNNNDSNTNYEGLEVLADAIAPIFDGLKTLYTEANEKCTAYVTGSQEFANRYNGENGLAAQIKAINDNAELNGEQKATQIGNIFTQKRAEEDALVPLLNECNGGMANYNALAESVRKRIATNLTETENAKLARIEDTASRIGREIVDQALDENKINHTLSAYLGLVWNGNTDFGGEAGLRYQAEVLDGFSVGGRLNGSYSPTTSATSKTIDLGTAQQIETANSELIRLGGLSGELQYNPIPEVGLVGGVGIALVNTNQARNVTILGETNNISRGGLDVAAEAYTGANVSLIGPLSAGLEGRYNSITGPSGLLTFTINLYKSE
jgi:hypothetical protein